jgi:protein-S-isoprenylcysteine O-methyltransferase Ste14
VRIYLLCGLLAHKALWELMKVRDSRPAEKKVRSLKVRVLSGIKLVILLAILAQTVTPTFLPIANAPASLRTVGLVCFTLGLMTAIVGRVQLGRNWSDIEKSYVKRDHALVVHGLYRYIRHPIYAGDLLLLLGLEMALNSWCFLGAIALALYVRQQAIREERNLLESLPGYDQYCSRTARFVPFVPV